MKIQFKKLSSGTSYSQAQADLIAKAAERRGLRIFNPPKWMTRFVKSGLFVWSKGVQLNALWLTVGDYALQFWFV